jgi:hypothetical protein
MAWWDSTHAVMDGTDATWFSGRVKSYLEIDIDSPYGPSCFYVISYNDGNKSDELADYWVFSNLDYLLSTRDEVVLSWIWLRNETDQTVSEEDIWPRIVGWYVVMTDGKDQSYPRLSGKTVEIWRNNVVHKAALCFGLKHCPRVLPF